MEELNHEECDVDKDAVQWWVMVGRGTDERITLQRVQRRSHAGTWESQAVENKQNGMFLHSCFTPVMLDIVQQDGAEVVHLPELLSTLNCQTINSRIDASEAVLHQREWLASDRY